ncbi:hypothetical protein D3C73_1227510 [compost metagenome]
MIFARLRAHMLHIAPVPVNRDHSDPVTGGREQHRNMLCYLTSKQMMYRQTVRIPLAFFEQPVELFLLILHPLKRRLKKDQLIPVPDLHLSLRINIPRQLPERLR